MGKSNNRRDSTKFNDYADDYDDYGDFRDIGSGTGRSMDPDADMSSDPAQASTATKANMSSRPMKPVGMGPGQRSQPAKQKAKRGNQTNR
jgi:hypothetical protein